MKLWQFFSDIFSLNQIHNFFSFFFFFDIFEFHGFLFGIEFEIFVYNLIDLKAFSRCFILLFVYNSLFWFFFYIFGVIKMFLKRSKIPVFPHHSWSFLNFWSTSNFWLTDEQKMKFKENLKRNDRKKCFKQIRYCKHLCCNQIHICLLLTEIYDKDKSYA